VVVKRELSDKTSQGICSADVMREFNKRAMPIGGTCTQISTAQAGMMRFSGSYLERAGGLRHPPHGRGQDTFVHVSSLPQPTPGPDEILTFEVGLNREARKRRSTSAASRSTRSGRGPAALGPARGRRHHGSPQDRMRWGGGAAVMLIAIEATRRHASACTRWLLPQ
jgi:hypothetical protein